jgi:ribosomal protein S18 acetylase RimI-like enzyme
MHCIIREYRPEDQQAVASLMEELQRHIAVIDPLQRHFCKQGYGDRYTADVVQRTQEGDGVFLVAEANKAIIGCMALLTIDHQQTDIELLGVHPLKDARVIELVVGAAVRNQGIGRQLMRAAEEFARSHACDGIRVEVFSPNTDAHRFYEKLGYTDRIVDMLKTL